MFSIRTKLLLLIVPVTMLLLAALGYFNYLQQVDSATRSTRAALQNTLAIKQAALVEYIEATGKIGAALANSEIVQSYSGLTNRNLSGNNRDTVEKLGQRVQALLHSVQQTHWGRYHHVFLVNRSNSVVISPAHGIDGAVNASALQGRNLTRNRWAMATLQTGKTTVSNYRSWKNDDHQHQVLFYPVRDSGNRIQAAIGFELHIPYQVQIAEQGFEMGASGRIYLVDLNGLPVERKDLANRIPLSGAALDQARLTGSWFGRRLNARGDEVFGHYLKNEAYQWILAAEIETEEVFAGIYRLQMILGGGAAVLLVLLLLLCILFSNTLVRPLREAISQLERISRGEFTIDILDTRRRDEIGSLVGALQQLVFSLQLVSKKIREAKAFRKAS